MFFTNLFCSSAKKDIPEEWNYSVALKYIIEYAKIDRVDLKEALVTV